MSHFTRTSALVLALALIAFACASEPEAEAEAVTATIAPASTTAPTTTSLATATTTTSTTTTLPIPTTTLPAGVQSPLNGLYVVEESLINRRVIAVKIDNHAEARPQTGVEQADAMIELMAEGVTRFIALSLQTDIEYLGPNRSVRPSDPTLVKPLNATLVISGGQDWIKSIVRSVGVPLNGEMPPASFRNSARRAPHNLYISTSLHRDLATQRGYSDEPMSQPWFVWGDLQGTEVANELELSWVPGLTVTWKYDEGRYVRHLGSSTQDWADSELTVQGPMSYDTIIVIVADQFTQGSPSGAGSAVPVMDTVGSGSAYVLANGLITTGTWARSSNGDPFTLTTDGGEPMLVPPGQLWVNIFPRDRPISYK